MEEGVIINKGFFKILSVLFAAIMFVSAAFAADKNIARPGKNIRGVAVGWHLRQIFKMPTLEEMTISGGMPGWPPGAHSGASSTPAVHVNDSRDSAADSKKDTMTIDQSKSLPPEHLEIKVNSCANVTMSNSYSYYNTIIADVRAALSADVTEGLVYETTC